VRHFRDFVRHCRRWARERRKTKPRVQPLEFAAGARSPSLCEVSTPSLRWGLR